MKRKTTLKTLVRAIDSPEAERLLAAGLHLTSTSRQLTNGTLVFTGAAKKRPVSYKITASGAVLSNEFVARRVATTAGDYPLRRYRAGMKAAGELLAKRLG